MSRWPLFLALFFALGPLPLLARLSPGPGAPTETIAAVVVAPDGPLEILARCPHFEPILNVAIDGGPPRAPDQIEPTDLPLSLALLIEAGPAMEQPGTPMHSRRADAQTLATALLERLPVDSRVSLIAVDGEPRLLSDGPPPTAMATLNRLDAPGVGSPRLAPALQLAADRLAEAPPGPHAVVLLANDVPEQAGVNAPLPEGIMLTVLALGSEPPGPLAELAAGVGGVYLSHSAASLAETRALFEGAIRQFDALIAARAHLRLSLDTGRLAPGAHVVELTGCAATPASAVFTTDGSPAAPPWLIPAGALTVGIGVALIYRRNRARKRIPRVPGSRPPWLLTATPRPVTARYQAVADLPTERHGRGEARHGLQLVIWEGDERSVHELSGRQCAIGREPGCDLRLDNSWVSGLHARLAFAGDRVELTDLDSTNGTFVGPERRRLAADSPEALAEGESFWIGPEIRAELQREEEL